MSDIFNHSLDASMSMGHEWQVEASALQGNPLHFHTKINIEKVAETEKSYLVNWVISSGQSLEKLWLPRKICRELELVDGAGTVYAHSDTFKNIVQEKVKGLSE